MSEKAPHQPTPTQSALEPVRPHEFDGIREFDKPMPNWWLFTLFASIAFAFLYWALQHAFLQAPDPGESLVRKMQIAAEEAAKKAGVLSDELLWKMSRDPAVVDSGKAIYQTNCAPCHLPDLAGAIGPNLKDNIWIHGKEPLTIVRIITEGVQAKGMPTWGQSLGRQRIADVTAFILSHHAPPTDQPK